MFSKPTFYGHICIFTKNTGSGITLNVCASCILSHIDCMSSFLGEFEIFVGPLNKSVNLKPIDCYHE